MAPRYLWRSSAASFTWLTPLHSGRSGANGLWWPIAGRYLTPIWQIFFLAHESKRRVTLLAAPEKIPEFSISGPSVVVSKPPPGSIFA